MNLQPSEAEAGFDIRIPPTADLEALERRLVEEWAPLARNMSFEVTFLSSVARNLTTLLYLMKTSLCMSAVAVRPESSREAVTYRRR